MLEISLNLYKIFYTVATSSSIMEASKKLYISQPAVSKSIKKLEEYLNVKLFYRYKKGIMLTSAGKEVFEYVDKSYNYLLAGEKMINELKDLKSGNLVIGVPSHIACFFALEKIQQFVEKYPNIKVRLISASTTFLLNELYNHKLDIIIDSTPIDIKSDMAEIKKLGVFETVFVCKKEEEINNLNLKNIDKYNYILPNKNSSMYKDLDSSLKEKNICLNASITADTTDVIITSVKLGLGIGYVVKDAVKNELSQNILKELKTPFKLPKLELDLVYMKNYLTYISKVFISEFLNK